MGGMLALLYGLTVYAIFFFTFLYTIGFVGNLFVPKSIDAGIGGPFVESLIIDALLLGLFAIQHSVMARPAFKRWWTRLVPPSIERSTYVLLASLALLLLYWQWRPLTHPVWTVQNSIGVGVIQALFWLGWAIVLISSFLIDHLDLFGLKQIFARLLNRELPPPVFMTPLAQTGGQFSVLPMRALAGALNKQHLLLSCSEARSDRHALYSQRRRTSTERSHSHAGS